MYRQQEETKGLPPMVFTTNVRMLVGNNMFQILTVHFEREIDSWFNYAKHKRRAYILTLENVVLVANSSINFAAQTPIADSRIQRKCNHAENPDVFIDTNSDLQRIYTGTSHRRIGLADDGINCVVYCTYSAIDGRGGIHAYVQWNSFGTWNQAQWAFKREWANQSDGYNAPKQNIDPFGSFLQNESENQHSQYKPACRYAHVDDLQKKFVHCEPPFLMQSIIRCTSSSSSSDIS